MNIVNTILNHPLLIEKPLVLIDIGASGGTHKAWKQIAHKATCIAFDADNRELQYEEKESAFFKKLLVINAIVTNLDNNELDFNLTRSPFCSSTLLPNKETLAEYRYLDSFDVIEKIKIKSITLTKALADVKIDYIDWFKTDSQGTDLRLFFSLPANIQNTISVAEFEPGIINAYHGEDMLYSVIQYMDSLKRFFCESCVVKGTPRIKNEYFDKIASGGFMAKLYKHALPQDASWAEIRYVVDNTKTTDTRSKLVAYLFSYILGQYGNALAIADSMQGGIDDGLLKQMKAAVYTKAKKSIFSLNFIKVIIDKLR